MKHASADSLKLLEDLLLALRACRVLRERTPGSFYRGGSAFLHFHEDPAGLFADAKLDLQNFSRFPVSTPGQRSALLDAVKVSLNGACGKAQGRTHV
jgi:hypothetical protein